MGEIQQNTFDITQYFKVLDRRLPTHAKNATARSLFLIILPTQVSASETRLQVLIKTHLGEETPIVFLPMQSLSSSCQNIITHVRKKLHEAILNYYPSACTAIYTHTSTYALRDKVEQLVQQAYGAILQLWKNQATLGVLGPRWIRNIWKNLSLPLRNSSLRTLNIGLPCINGYACVIGAGPSLSTPVLQLLQRYRNKIVIIACDTALPALNASGIVPDICVVLESQYYNIRDFLPPPYDTVHLLCDISAHPTTMRIFSRVQLFCTEFAPLSFFARMAKAFGMCMPALGSVGVSATHIALLSGAHAVLLSGLDFAFYKGRSHCLHSPAHTAHMLEHTRLNPWSSAVAHCLHTGLHPLEIEPTRKNLSPAKLSDKTLTGYAQEIDSMLKAFTTTNSQTQVYEMNNLQSMLHYTENTQPLEYYETMLKQAPPAVLQWETRIITKKTLRSLLTYELESAAYIQETMASYKKQEITPPYEMWSSHLDFYACTLLEDTYQIRKSLQNGDAAYWKKNKLYDKIYLNAARVVQDIRICLR